VNHWIVIADAASVRIYRSDEALETYTLVQSTDNPQVHPDPDELGPRGATRSRPGGERSRFDRHTDPHDAERSRFAKEVAQVVEQGLERRAWERLVIVAPPAFLGDLRHHLSERALRGVVASIHHDFTATPEHELPAAVRRHLPDLAGMP
jgi:protein required for attachment to host cells